MVERRPYREDEQIDAGVGVGGVADQRAPLIDRELAGEDLQQVVARSCVERLETPVVA
jgi:hypothetical protein